MSTNQCSSDNTAKNSLSRPKFAIGTVSTNISYSRNAQVFKPSDVPAHARQRKEYVKESLQVIPTLRYFTTIFCYVFCVLDYYYYVLGTVLNNHIFHLIYCRWRRV